MEQWVRRCMAYMSDMNAPQVLKHASFRHIGKQKSILDGANIYAIKCLLIVHRGELREWSGWWELESHILNLLEVKWHMKKSGRVCMSMLIVHLGVCMFVSLVFVR